MGAPHGQVHVPISFVDSRFYRVFSSFVDRFLRSFFDRLVIFLCEWGLHTARYTVPISFAGNAFRKLFRRKMERFLTR